MAKVTVQEGETLDAALRRFRKSLEKSGVLRAARRRKHYEKPSDRRRRERARAQRRRQR
ncbi:MAG: 30S ribosomal protein S21 [Armatimonadota bacterium]